MAKQVLDDLATGAVQRQKINENFTEAYYPQIGKAGGQTIVGGTSSGESLVLQANAHDETTGDVNIKGATCTLAMLDANSVLATDTNKRIVPAGSTGTGDLVKSIGASLTTPELTNPTFRADSRPGTGFYREFSCNEIDQSVFNTITQAKIQSSTDEGTLLGDVSGTKTIHDHFFVAGSVFELHLYGGLFTKASEAGTVTIRPKLRGTTIPQPYTMTLPDNVSNGGWEGKFIFVIRSFYQGDPVIYPSGFVKFYGTNGAGIPGAQYFFSSSTFIFAVGTTNDIDFTGQFSVATDNFMSCEMATLKRMR